ncbi:hypothetical protein, partial [Mumia zhuanghuii]|uniref:hypothetical protein n=1 Tax=Mumia zhuanghuii TaxID=2585211 RepID=UPI001E3B5CA1
AQRKQELALSVRRKRAWPRSQLQRRFREPPLGKTKLPKLKMLLQFPLKWTRGPPVEPTGRGGWQ